MKTSKQKVVEFMEAKQEYLDKHSSNKVDYFRDADKHLLNEFTEKECIGFISKYIYFYRSSLRSSDFFGGTSCIFCFKYSGDCSYCPYGKTKGICATGRDIWSSIPEEIKPTPIPPEIHEILIN